MHVLQPITAKRVAIALAALAVGAALTWAMWPKPVPVDIAQVSLGPMRVTVDEEGKTRIKDVYAVSAPVGGKVLRRTLEPGDAENRRQMALLADTLECPDDLAVRLGQLRGHAPQGASQQLRVAPRRRPPGSAHAPTGCRARSAPPAGATMATVLGAQHFAASSGSRGMSSDTGSVIEPPAAMSIGPAVPQL